MTASIQRIWAIFKRPAVEVPVERLDVAHAPIRWSGQPWGALHRNRAGHNRSSILRTISAEPQRVRTLGSTSVELPAVPTAWPGYTTFCAK
jgi:hypothetical protein